MKLTKERIEELIAELDKQSKEPPLIIYGPRIREQIDEALRNYSKTLIKPTFGDDKEKG